MPMLGLKKKNESSIFSERMSVVRFRDMLYESTWE
jgi:hypothetical protein